MIKTIKRVGKEYICSQCDFVIKRYDRYELAEENGKIYRTCMNCVQRCMLRESRPGK